MQQQVFAQETRTNIYLFIYFTFHQIFTEILNVCLVLLPLQNGYRHGRIPKLYNCSNVDGKENSGHASDVHCAAIFEVTIFSLSSGMGCRLYTSIQPS
jgi:hypothetical protein